MRASSLFFPVALVVASALSLVRASKIKTTISFLKERLDGDVYYWDEAVDAADHGKPMAIGHLELIGGASRIGADSAAGASVLSSFIEEGAMLHARAHMHDDPSADPQSLSPDSMQCYCKFKRPMIQTVPASAFNNAGQTLPTDDEGTEETSFLEKSSKAGSVARMGDLGLLENKRGESDAEGKDPRRLRRREDESSGSDASSSMLEPVLLDIGETLSSSALSSRSKIGRKSRRVPTAFRDGDLDAYDTELGRAMEEAKANDDDDDDDDYMRGYQAGLKDAMYHQKQD